MKSLIDAARLLTVLPFPADERPLRPSLLSWFPIVGLGIGLGLAAAHAAIYPLVSNRVSESGGLGALIVVLSWIVLTRGLHLDGVGDTFDAIGAIGDRARRLEILRDPHIGALGCAAVVMVLVSKVTILANLSKTQMMVALICAAVSARWMAVLACAFFRYAREEGLGVAFIGRATRTHVFWTSAVTLTILLLSEKLFMPVALAALGSGFLVAAASNRAFGGITGDVLGAVIETVECAVLFVFAAAP